jgi:hypothetical protein
VATLSDLLTNFWQNNANCAILMAFCCANVMPRNKDDVVLIDLKIPKGRKPNNAVKLLAILAAALVIIVTWPQIFGSGT